MLPPHSAQRVNPERRYGESLSRRRTRIAAVVVLLRLTRVVTGATTEFTSLMIAITDVDLG
jgi:hypothetical protein